MGYGSRLIFKKIGDLKKMKLKTIVIIIPKKLLIIIIIENGVQVIESVFYVVRILVKSKMSCSFACHRVMEWCIH